MVWAVVVVVCALSSIGYSTTDNNNNFNIIHGYTQSELQAFINETVFSAKNLKSRIGLKS